MGNLCVTCEAQSCSGPPHWYNADSSEGGSFQALLLFYSVHCLGILLGGRLLLGGLSSGGGNTGKFLEKQICAGRERKGQRDRKSGCERAIGPGAGDGREERHSPTPSVSLRVPGLAMLEQRFSTVFSIWLSWGD